MYLFLLFTLLCLKTTVVYGQTRLLNGQDAKEGQFPYQALVISRKSGYCGGSIIHERWILSVAHCRHLDPSNTLVYVGTIKNFGESGWSYAIEKIIDHEAFNFSTREVVNDIALIRLKSAIAFNDRVKPVKLPVRDLKAGRERLFAVISGWGITGVSSEKRLVIPKILQYVHVRVINRCRHIWKRISNKHICTSISDGKSACVGDSGGPVVINGTQVGIVSFGDGFPCSYGLPNVHTRVFSYMHWIKHTMNLYSDKIND